MKKATKNKVIRGMLLLVLLLLATASASWSIPSASAGSGPGWSKIDNTQIYAGFIIDRLYDGRCGDTCDFYGVSTIEGNRWGNEDKGNQDLLENDNSIRPGWRFIAPVPIQTYASLKLQIYDEDGGFQGGDDHLDVTHSSGKDIELTLNLPDCKASGNIGTFAGVRQDGMCEIVIKGIGGTSGDRAKIDFRIVWFYHLTFYNPTFNGYRLDYCAVWGNFCGYQAAHEYCASLHDEIGLFKFTTGHRKAEGVSPTQVIRSGQICNNGTCDSFASITCTTYKYGPF